MKYGTKDDLFDRLNLPEEQIQKFFLTGEIQLSGYQKHEIVEEMEVILLDIVETEKHVHALKRLLSLATTLNIRDINELNRYLNEFLSE